MEWKMVWNMEDAQNGMEGCLPYSNTKYKYSIYQNLQQITKNYQTRKRRISHISVLHCEFLACFDQWRSHGGVSGATTPPLSLNK